MPMKVKIDQKREKQVLFFHQKQEIGYWRADGYFFFLFGIVALLLRAQFHGPITVFTRTFSLFTRVKSFTFTIPDEYFVEKGQGKRY